jgi:hypothetical protein
MGLSSFVFSDTLQKSPSEKASVLLAIKGSNSTFAKVPR